MTARPRPGDNNGPPSTFTLQHSSPLETLVRRTSGRERRNEFKRPVPVPLQQSTKPPFDTPRSRSALGNIASDGATTAAAAAPAGSSQGSSTLTVDIGLASGRSVRPVASSPLLHSTFRNSTATTIDDNSSQRISRADDYHSGMTALLDSMTQEVEYDDDRSVYSLPSAPPWQASHPSAAASDPSRDSWTSSLDYYATNHATTRETMMTYGSSMTARGDAPYASSGEMSPGLPTVVVSDYDAGSTGTYGPAPSRVAKTPVVQTTAGITNFSRPMRPPVLPAWEQKQKVLERNHSRRGQQQHNGDDDGSSRSISPSNQPQPPQHQQYQGQSPPDTAPLGRRSPGIRSTNDSSVRSPSPHAAPDYPLPATPSQSSVSHLTPVHQSHPRSLSPGSSTSTSSLTSSSTIAAASNSSLSLLSHSPTHPYSSSSPSLLPSTVSQGTMPLTPGNASSPQVPLHRKPPSLRPASPTSVYSAYSYYQLPSPNHSDGSRSSTPGGGNNGGMHLRASPSGGNTPGSRLSPSNGGSEPTTPTSTSEYYLQLGIQHHEANRLQESAAYFERSAMGDAPPGSKSGGGGCGVGMLMWGLTLRHGWGVPKDEKAAFKWLRRAAELATDDLELTRQKGGAEVNLLQKELVLAIYEVAQCFFHGWGVKKDQKMAVSYYTVAARLGDPDAQQDLAFALANGKGCKKDRKEAAKWYRAAVAQGASDVGLAWIYKEKYQ